MNALRQFYCSTCGFSHTFHSVGDVWISSTLCGKALMKRSSSPQVETVVSKTMLVYSHERREQCL